MGRNRGCLRVVYEANRLCIRGASSCRMLSTGGAVDFTEIAMTGNLEHNGCLNEPYRGNIELRVNIALRQFPDSSPRFESATNLSE